MRFHFSLLSFFLLCGIAIVLYFVTQPQQLPLQLSKQLSSTQKILHIRTVDSNGIGIEAVVMILKFSTHDTLVHREGVLSDSTGKVNLILDADSCYTLQSISLQGERNRGSERIDIKPGEDWREKEIVLMNTIAVPPLKLKVTISDLPPPPSNDIPEDEIKKTRTRRKR